MPGVLKAKVGGSWVEIPQVPSPPAQDMYRVFATKALLDTNWPYPPEGAQAYVVADKMQWIYAAGTGWISPAPRGVLDYGERTTNAGPSAGTGAGGDTLDGTLLRVDFVLPVQRRVRLTGFLRTITSSVNADFFNLTIKRVSDNIVLESALLGPCNPTSGIMATPVIYEPLLAAGTHAYVLGMQRSVGTGNFTVYGTTVSPIWISAVDIGEI